MIVLFQAENLIYTITRVCSDWRVSGSLVPGKNTGCKCLICDLCKAMKAEESGYNSNTV